MALLTLGTSATTSLHALVQNTNLTIADGATIRANIKYDGVNGNAVVPGAYEFQGGQGTLYIPRRGTLQVLPGDYVAYDSSGWPILVSAYAIANAAWTHS